MSEPLFSADNSLVVPGMNVFTITEALTIEIHTVKECVNGNKVLYERESIEGWIGARHNLVYADVRAAVLEVLKRRAGMLGGGQNGN